MRGGGVVITFPDGQRTSGVRRHEAPGCNAWMHSSGAVVVWEDALDPGKFRVGYEGSEFPYDRGRIRSMHGAGTWESVYPLVTPDA